MRRRYTCRNFLLDVLLIFLTQGLWLIWIIIRWIRNNCCCK